MKLDTLLNLPPQAMERVLDQVLAGKVELEGVNLWVDDPNVAQEWAAGVAGETDLFVLNGEPATWQGTSIGALPSSEGGILGPFEPGVDKIILTDTDADTIKQIEYFDNGVEVRFRYGDATLPPPYDNTHSALLVWERPAPGDLILI